LFNRRRPKVTLAVSPLGREALDQPGTHPALVEATLKDIARLNALLGGRAAAAYGLKRLLQGVHPEAPVSLLDVGAGSGDITEHLARRAARWGVTLTPVAIERHPIAAGWCRRAGLRTVMSDGGDLPLRASSVDIVLASQLLHHLERASAVALLREMDRVARVGAIVADLRRHAVAALGIWLVSYPLRLHAVTRRDGVTSVRRGYTPEEMRALLRDACLVAEVSQRPGYRLVAVWRKRPEGPERPEGKSRALGRVAAPPPPAPASPATPPSSWSHRADG
jgi:SAM-dependent methyltransferase